MRVKWDEIYLARNASNKLDEPLGILYAANVRTLESRVVMKVDGCL